MTELATSLVPEIATISATSIKVADHLIALPDPQWAFWRTLCLRGTGFPAKEVEQLSASADLVNSVTAVLKAEHEIEEHKRVAIQDVDGLLDQLRAMNHWDDRSRRKALLKARQNLRSGKLSDFSADISTLPGVALVLNGVENARAAKSAFQEVLSGYYTQLGHTIRKIARLPRFREAMVWQNRAAVHTALDVLLRKQATRRSSAHRQHEELVASYLQRYTVKNDSIGFFGPVGWAEFSEENDMVVKPGRDLLAARTVYFEAWPIEELAAVIVKDPAVRQSLAPILMPFISLKGPSLNHAIYGPKVLTTGQAAILELCNGVRPAREIAETLLRTHPEIFHSAGESYDILVDLCSKQILFWNLDVEPGPYPERELRKKLDGIADVQARERAMGLLHQLESARDGVAAAAGDAEKLDAAFETLERTYVRLTGKPPTRNHGQTYGARTVVYEDCRRDLQLRLGQKLLRDVGEPLSLLLDSARWVNWQVVEGYQRKLMELYRGIVRTTGKSAIPAPELWLKAMPYLGGKDVEDIGNPVQQEFQRKWARILGPEIPQKAVTYCSDELRPLVKEEFAAPSAGWSHGRYHGPDIMIAAASPEAIERGDYTIIAGEVHVACNTISPGLFVYQHPSPDALVRAMEKDLGSRQLRPVPPKQDTLSIGRTFPALISPDDLRLEYTWDSFIADRFKAVPIASLLVEERNGELVTRAPDGQFFKALDLVGWRCTSLVRDSFKMFLPRDYNPRISIDRMVIRREAWRAAAADLAFAAEEDTAERFLQFRRWAELHNMPRFLFYKSPVEEKPTYLDLNSPILADIFCRTVRRTLNAKLPDSSIEITEMLPTPDQAWLPDAQGNRYLCELRIVALDLIA